MLNTGAEVDDDVPLLLQNSNNEAKNASSSAFQGQRDEVDADVPLLLQNSSSSNEAKNASSSAFQGQRDAPRNVGPLGALQQKETACSSRRKLGAFARKGGAFAKTNANKAGAIVVQLGLLQQNETACSSNRQRIAFACSINRETSAFPLS